MTQSNDKLRTKADTALATNEEYAERLREAEKRYEEMSTVHCFVSYLFQKHFQERNDLQQQLEGLCMEKEALLEQARVQVVELETRASRVEQLEQQLNVMTEESANKVPALEAHIEELTLQKAQLEAECKSCVEKLTTVEQQRTEQSDVRFVHLKFLLKGNCLQERDALVKQLTELQSERSDFLHEQETQRATITDLEERIACFNEAQQQQNNYAEKLAALETCLAELSQQNEELQSQHNTATNKLRDAEQKCDELSKVSAQ